MTNINHQFFMQRGDVTLMTLADGTPVVLDTVEVSKIIGYGWRVNAYKGNRIRIEAHQVLAEGKKKYLLPRLILGLPDDMFVSYTNGNMLDNRKCNLTITASPKPKKRMKKAVEELVAKDDEFTRLLQEIRCKGKLLSTAAADNQQQVIEVEPSPSTQS